MRKYFNAFLIAVTIVLLFSGPVFSREILLYSFEKDPEGWEIPEWAFGKKDHVAKEVGVTEFQASSGKYALEIGVDFQNVRSWQGAYVERIVDVTDWSQFNYLSADIFLPKDAPPGLRGRIILSVGEDWKWTEMNKAVLLIPGEWNIIKTDLTPNSMNWRRFVTDGFRGDVRKIGIRIESNGNVNYKGSVYIDNIKLSD